MSKKENEVVVYAALDREFSEPILQDMAEVLKLNVLPRYDVESNKTVGLANAIIAEKNRPRCDIFWNNEILHTLRLQEAGLLEAWTCEPAKRFPSEFVSSENQWYGFAARARVLIVNTDLVAETDRPDSIDDLLDPKWKDKCCIARPLFGTSATHAAVTFEKLGDEKAADFYRRLAENAEVLGGNKQVAQKVAAGQFAFGLTDTDDAIIEIENTNPVASFLIKVMIDPEHFLFPTRFALSKTAPTPFVPSDWSSDCWRPISKHGSPKVTVPRFQSPMMSMCAAASNRNPN